MNFQPAYCKLYFVFILLFTAIGNTYAQNTGSALDSDTSLVTHKAVIHDSLKGLSLRAEKDTTVYHKAGKKVQHGKTILKQSGNSISKKDSTAKSKLSQALLKGKSRAIASDSSLKSDSSSIVKTYFKKNKKSILSKLDHTSTHGSITAGYDYGVLPFASNIKVPMGYFHGEGQGQFQLGILPFNGSFYYSGIKNISGLNNYFRVSFDVQKFQQEYRDKMAQEKKLAKDKLMGLYKQRQKAEQKLLYLQSIQNRPLPATPKLPAKPQLPHYSLSKDQLAQAGDSLKNKAIDSLKEDAKSLLMDTTALGNMKDSLRSDSAALMHPQGAIHATNMDSSKVFGNSQQDISKGQDTLRRTKEEIVSDIEKYRAIIAKCNNDISEVQQKIKMLKNASSAFKQKNPFLSNLYNVMGGVKKLEVGLCYPSYSTFLINGMAIKGFNVEYEKHIVYAGVTEGRSVNTLLFTNNALQNHLVNTQNLYNMFDFSKVQNGRKILAGKVGVGKKEGTHLSMGMLYGSGLPSYMPDSNNTLPNGISKNYVFEVDAGWNMGKTGMLTMVYGKSSTQTTTNTYSTTDGGLFNADKTKAVMGNYKLSIPKTRSNITLTGKWLDPYFNSFGLGYIRTNNFRYEAKLGQSIGKRIKFTVFMKKDEDNVLQLYQYRTVLQTIGSNASIRLLRSLRLRVGYTPVVEKMQDFTNPANNLTNHNAICNGVLTFAPITHGTMLAANMAYNYYQLSSDTQKVQFENFSFSNLVRLKNSLSNNISASWFKAIPADSLDNNVWMFSDELGYNFSHGVMVSGGGKAAYSLSSYTWQWGYVLKIKVPLVKHFSCELSGEKLVLGDFYNSFDIVQIEKFPYYLTGKLILHW